MMNYIYFKERIINDDLGEYKSYGIQTEDGKGIISDVSCELSEVKEIVDILNCGQVEFVHMEDVILDMIK